MAATRIRSWAGISGLVYILSLLCSGAAADQLDISFAQRPERELLLNIYTPVAIKEPAPVLVYVYGGSYVTGDRQVLRRDGQILQLTEDGVAVVTFDYRYSQEAVFPAQILDVTAAICWVKKHASAYHLDPQRLALLGYSAGGHLAALAGAGHTEVGIRDASCADIASGISVNAVVDFFGPTDFVTAMEEDVTNPQVFTIIEQLFGGPIAGHPSMVGLASVLNKVSVDDPPLLMVHGDRDRVVPYRQSQRLLQAYEAIGHDAHLITVSGGDHGHGGDKNTGFGSAALWQQVRQFLLHHLGMAEVVSG